MAVERRGGKRTTYRAYWRNPNTGKIEKGESRSTIEEARLDDADVKRRLKLEPWTFRSDDGPTPAHKRAPLTFADVARLYLARRDLAANTVQNTFSGLKKAAELFGSTLATEVTRADLRRYEAILGAMGLRQSSIYLRLRMVRNVLSWARNEELIETHQLDGYKAKRGERSPNPPPSPAEVKALLDVAAPPLRRAIILAYYLGLRFGPSEVLSVTWADYNREERTLTVRCNKNEKRPWRNVYLPEPVVQEMEAWRKADAGIGAECIVHIDGRKVHRLREQWEKALRLSGITRPIKAYDLRHTHATQALAGGADMKAVASSMGHQDVSMLHEVYQNVVDSQRRQVTASIPDILGVQTRGTGDDPKMSSRASRDGSVVQ